MSPPSSDPELAPSSSYWSISTALRLYWRGRMETLWRATSRRKAIFTERLRSLLDDLSAIDLALLLDVVEDGSPRPALASEDAGAVAVNELDALLLDDDTKTDGSNSDTTTIVITNAQQPGARSTACRQRQREELEYLRKQVRELEQELQALKPSPRPEEEPTGAPRAPSLSVAWERIAKHQMNAKRRAEDENRKLKQKLEGQLKIARGLEKLLRKRPNQETDDSILDAKRRRRATSTDAAVYQQLIGNLEKRHKEYPQAFRENGFATHKADLEDTRVLTDSTNQLAVEMLHAKVFPFDLTSTSAAVWKCASLSYLALSQGFYAAQNVADDILTSKFEMALEVRRHKVTMHVCVAMNKIEEVPGQRVVLTWDSFSTIRSPHKSFDGIQLTDHGWTVAETLPAAKEDNPLTLVQCCSRFSPDAETIPLNSPVGVLSDVMLASYHDNYQTLCETVEGLLLQDALGIT